MINWKCDKCNSIKKGYYKYLCENCYKQNRYPLVREKILVRAKKNNQRPEIKEKRRKYAYAYKQRSTSKLIMNRSRNKYRNKRKEEDLNYYIQCLIHTAFTNGMKQLSFFGKTNPQILYGIDLNAIIKHLGEKPNDGNEYDIDHIIPKSWFDHNNPLEVKWCWAPENLQWLRHDINMWKSNRFILKLSLEEQEKWPF